MSGKERTNQKKKGATKTQVLCTMENVLKQEKKILVCILLDLLIKIRGSFTPVCMHYALYKACPLVYIMVRKGHIENKCVLCTITDMV